MIQLKASLLDRSNKQEVKELNDLLSDYNNLLNPSLIKEREDFAEKASKSFADFETVAKLKLRPAKTTSEPLKQQFQGNLKDIL